MTEPINESLDKVANALRQLEGVVESLILNDTAIVEGLAQMLSTVQQIDRRSEESQKKHSERIRELGLVIESTVRTRCPQKPILVTLIDQFDAENPEIGLLQYLYSFLTERNAIDVGAHVGWVSERLLRSGYSVYAFEPYAPVFRRLHQRCAGCASFHAFPFAIGPADGKMDLHIVANVSPDGTADPTLFNTLARHPLGHDFHFIETCAVEVRSLESLRQAGEIPQGIGLLKIDTEGFDLEVIRGLGQLRPSVVMAEFWDASHEFGKSGKGRLEDLIIEMKNRDYLWHLVIYHADESSTISYYPNRRDTVPSSWGNVIFFQDQGVFAEALRWVADVLPPTLFR